MVAQCQACTPWTLSFMGCTYMVHANDFLSQLGKLDDEAGPCRPELGGGEAEARNLTM